MFDIGWSEILVIAVVAILVVGPKELPRMLRTFGKTMGQVRRTANDFKRQFDQALREAEREAGLEETRKQLQSVTKMEPLKPAAAPAAEKPATIAREAPPAKTGAAASVEKSDAA